MNQKTDLLMSQNLYFIRQTPLVLVAKIIGLELLLGFVYLVFRVPKLFFLDLIPLQTISELSIVGVVLFIIMSTMQLVLAVALALSWTNEYYVIRPTDILHRQGILSLKEETFSLKNVEAFTVYQDWLGKLFNYGSIQFYSPVLKQEYFLNNVSNPVSLKESIEATVRSAHAQQAQSSREMIIPIRNR